MRHLLWTLPILSLCACTSIAKPGRLEARGDYQEAKTKVRARLPYDLAVAPMRLALDRAPADDALPSSRFSARALRAVFLFPSRLPVGSVQVAVPGTLESELIDGCRGLGLFPRVEAVRGATEQADLSELLNHARDAGFDFLLVPTITTSKVRYVRESRSWWLSFTLWFMTWFGEWVVPDEVYAAQVGMDLEVHHVRTGQRVYGPHLDAEFRETLNDLQRGWCSGGVILAPDWLDEDNYNMVGDGLMPHASQKLVAGACDNLASGLQPILADRSFVPLVKASAQPETIAVVIGIGSYANGDLGEAAHAQDDAAAIASILLSPDGMNLPPHNVLVRKDQEATVQAVRTALSERLHAKAFDIDRVIVYFAGLGATDHGNDGVPRRYLLAHDSDPGRLAETALDTGELVDALLAAGAAQVVLILDTSFAGGTGGRTATPRDDDTGAATDLARLAEYPNAAVILAAAPKETAVAWDKVGQGLFTYFLVDGLREAKADKDSDGRITLEEVFDHAEVRTKRQASAMLRGQVQSPTWLGSHRIEFVLK